MSKQKEKSGKVLASSESNSHEGVDPIPHRHERFPTEEELDPYLRKEVLDTVSVELALLSYERHLIRTTDERNPGPAISPSPRDFSALRSRPSIPVNEAVLSLVSILNSRVDHRDLTAAERNRFNNALMLSHQAGSYQALAEIHSMAGMMKHRMHTMHGGAVGTQRFLPWHRLYVLQCENLLRTYEPGLRIPYWDYARDGVRPDWVWKPPQVDRLTPGNGTSLPTLQTINSIQQKVSYTDFTFDLEVNGHNQVHNWCNGTITDPATAAYDPIFWLLHANVDRIWNGWQTNHNGKPILKALDWILDPYALPASDVDSILVLGYWYR